MFKGSKLLKLVLRIVISAILVWLLVSHTDISEIGHALMKTNHTIVILCVVIYLLGQVISSVKWQLICETVGFRNQLKDYIKYYFVGMFFSLFLPTTVGGDFIKALYLSKGDTTKRKAPSIYTVLIDRYSGVAVIVAMAVVGMCLPIAKNVPVAFKILTFSLMAVICIVTPILPSFLMRFFKNKKWARTMLRDIKVYWHNPQMIIKILLWSLLFHFTIILIHLAIADAMNLHIPPLYFLVLYPLSAIAGFVPFSFNGLGPREAVYIVLLNVVGIKQPQAIVFSLLWFSIVLLSGFVGVIPYIKEKFNKLSENMQEDFDIIKESEMADEDENSQLENISATV
jgi:uncharacterized membrane protein YbhN (UPF0104 family)